MPGLITDLILGMDVLASHNFTVELQRASVFLDGDLVTATGTQQPPANNNNTCLILTGNEQKRLQEFLNQELPLFESVRGTTPLIEHKIHLLKTEPIKQRYRHRNPKMQEVINAEVDTMLAEGIIEPSNSP